MLWLSTTLYAVCVLLKLFTVYARAHVQACMHTWSFVCVRAWCMHMHVYVCKYVYMHESVYARNYVSVRRLALVC